jgi:hypothetical protein
MLSNALSEVLYGKAFLRLEALVAANSRDKTRSATFVIGPVAQERSLFEGHLPLKRPGVKGVLLGKYCHLQ